MATRVIPDSPVTARLSNNQHKYRTNLQKGNIYLTEQLVNRLRHRKTSYSVIFSFQNNF